VGGETAEMPGLYTPPDYDLAGFIVGIVEESRTLGAHRVREGDVLIGLASSGLHTNGYSLARKIVADRMRLGTRDAFPGANGATIADVLLSVHRSYLPMLRGVLDHIHALAHITGGGLPGNLNRVLPGTMDAQVNTSSWQIPDVFLQLERAGGVERAEMFRAFNMGVGMVVITDLESADRILAAGAAGGVTAWRMGRITPGAGRVILNSELDT
jgi:phosphoribosylformylglycinamidine cyclo-ligase